MAERYSTAHRRYIVFIHSSVEGYLGCFGALAIVNSAALNIRMCVSSNYGVFNAQSGVTGARDGPIFRFLRQLHAALHIAAPVWSPFFS